MGHGKSTFKFLHLKALPPEWFGIVNLQDQKIILNNLFNQGGLSFQKGKNKFPMKIRDECLMMKEHWEGMCSLMCVMNIVHT